MRARSSICTAFGQIAKNCGSCHVERYQTYTETYHGQVHSLGYAYTAHCFDCHGSHNIQMVADPTSTVHRNNRLQTCQKCHANAIASREHAGQIGGLEVEREDSHDTRSL